jgi:hypothetical protein
MIFPKQTQLGALKTILQTIETQYHQTQIDLTLTDKNDIYGEGKKAFPVALAESKQLQAIYTHFLTLCKENGIGFKEHQGGYHPHISLLEKPLIKEQDPIVAEQAGNTEITCSSSGTYVMLTHLFDGKFHQFNPAEISDVMNELDKYSPYKPGLFQPAAVISNQANATKADNKPGM